MIASTENISLIKKTTSELIVDRSLQAKLKNQFFMERNGFT